MTDKILVAGIGNIFLGDDAFGVEVARTLLACGSGGDSVRVVDFGIRGLDLAYALLEPWELVILADAAPRGGAPGTLYVMEPAIPHGVSPGRMPAMDGHAMDPVAVLELAAALGAPAHRVRVIGCEPTPMPPEMDDAAYQEMSAGLSDAVRRAVPEAVRIIGEMIERISSGRFRPEEVVL